MTASHFDFVDVVATGRDLLVASGDAHVCRLEPRESDLAWFCDLDDGTPSSGESDPAAFVRWVCPSLRDRPSTTGTAVPLIDVRRPGPRSDLSRLLKKFGRLAGGASHAAGSAVEGRFVYTDPGEILDAELRRRIESWPLAQHGDGVVRPAELWSISVTREGLIVESVSWWGSAPALDHQIGLALDIARRLTPLR